MKNEKYPMLDLFERTPDLVCVVNKAGWFIQINPAVVKTLGYSEEELFSKPVSDFIHPEDRELTRRERTKLLGNEPLINFQNRYVNKNGETVWLQWTSIYLPDKEIVFALAKNITKTKQVEIEIEKNYKKYKSLTSHFKNNIEKDRKYFAAELHEELAQLAAVIKIDLDLLHSSETQLPEPTKARIEHALSASHLLLDKIRKISYSISPDIIADLGFNEVMLSLCNDFSSLTGIACVFENYVDENELGHEIKLDFLRICQEALLNVMHHANASLVTIVIEMNEEEIHLSIIDDGKGFEYSKDKKKSGLTTIQGRAASINGRMTIESKLSEGTKLKVSIDTKDLV